MSKLPPLNALPAFEATARLGSMTAAAEELGRTHGAVSKQVAHLSEQLGRPLFERDGVGLRLTPDGAELAAVLRKSLDEIASVWALLKMRSNNTVLDIGVSATFAMRWLIPRLPGFYERAPGVQLRFQMTGHGWISDADADLILTWDRLREPVVQTRNELQPLGDVAFGIVQRPGLDASVEGDTYKVGTLFLQSAAPDTLEAWQELSGIRVDAQVQTLNPHLLLSLEAALAGLGATLMERRLVAADLKAGRLEAPFGFVVIPDGLAAILTPRGKARAEVTTFLDWVREEVRADT